MQKELGLTYIDGRPWIVALPDGGQSRAKSAESEFAQMVSTIGKEAFNCKVASWCANKSSETRCEEGEGYWWEESGFVTQYDGSKENWNLENEAYRGYMTGFRPVLIPADPETLQPDPSRLADMEDGKILQMGTLYIDDYPLPNPTKPIGCGQPKHGSFGPFVGNIPRFTKGASLKLGDTSPNPRQQIKFVKVGDQLVSDRVIMGCISIADLKEHLRVQEITPQLGPQEVNPSEPIMLWGRLGFSMQVTPEELNALRSDPEKAQALLLDLLSSNRCFIDGETYLPGPANEKYFSDDLEFNLPRMPLSSVSLPERSKEAERNDISAAVGECSKHISDIVKGDIIMFGGFQYVAQTDAYKVKTDLGSEWNVEVAGDGPADYIYASYFPGGFVNVVPKQEKTPLKDLIQSAKNRGTDGPDTPAITPEMQR